MRRIKYFVANSLDGFISRQDGRVDWLFMDQDYGLREFFEYAHPMPYYLQGAPQATTGDPET